MKQQLEEAKLRIIQLENECQSVRDKSAATVSHLTKAMFDLKQVRLYLVNFAQFAMFRKCQARYNNGIFTTLKKIL